MFLIFVRRGSSGTHGAAYSLVECSVAYGIARLLEYVCSHIIESCPSYAPRQVMQDFIAYLKRSPCCSLFNGMLIKKIMSMKIVKSV
jgi:hypothetical protein